MTNSSEPIRPDLTQTPAAGHGGLLLLIVAVLLTSMAAGTGWGIRGQYGHETGAMIAGTLAALTLVLLFVPGAVSLTGARAAAMMATAIGIGGSMTYGQTVGLSHDHEIIGNAAAWWWGMLGLFVKGGVWIGFGGLLLGMGLGGNRYRSLETGLLLVAAAGLFFAGVWLLNLPFDPANKQLPHLYFSDHWDFEPEKYEAGKMKCRFETWGGYWLALIGLMLYTRFVRGDRLALRMAIAGILGGGLGFSGGQCVQSAHAWHPEWFRHDSVVELYAMDADGNATALRTDIEPAVAPASAVGTGVFLDIVEIEADRFLRIAGHVSIDDTPAAETVSITLPDAVAEALGVDNPVVVESGAVNNPLTAGSFSFAVAPVTGNAGFAEDDVVMAVLDADASMTVTQPVTIRAASLPSDFVAQTVDSSLADALRRAAVSGTTVSLTEDGAVMAEPDSSGDADAFNGSNVDGGLVLQPSGIAHYPGSHWDIRGSVLNANGDTASGTHVVAYLVQGNGSRTEIGTAVVDTLPEPGFRILAAPVSGALDNVNRDGRFGFGEAFFAKFNWWNVMETTFGAIWGAILALGLWFNRRLIDVSAADDRITVPPVAEILLAVLYVTFILVGDFGYLNPQRLPVNQLDYLETHTLEFISYWYVEIGIVLATLPLIGIAGGRIWPYMMLMLLIAVPICGKTLRAVGFNGDDTWHPGFAWFCLVQMPLAWGLVITAWLVQKSRVHTAGRFAAVALIFTTLTFVGLNSVFFGFAWPWDPFETWGGRHPNQLFFLVSAACLITASLLTLLFRPGTVQRTVGSSAD